MHRHSCSDTWCLALAHVTAFPALYISVMGEPKLSLTVRSMEIIPVTRYYMFLAESEAALHIYGKAIGAWGTTGRQSSLLPDNITIKGMAVSIGAVRSS